jgi:biopolymer transport protein TolR
LLTTGVQVDLPKAKSAPMQADDTKMLVIVTRDEQVFLGKDDITGAVEDKLKTNARLKDEKELYIQADENVKYGAVLRVMAAARTAGVEKLGMITDPLTVK